MTTRPIREALLDDLTPDEQDELKSVLHALHRVAVEDLPTGEMFEPNGLNRAFMEMSPAVKNKLLVLRALTDEKRSLPYQAKMNTPEWADTLGLDADTMDKLKATLDAADVVGKLHVRMGGDHRPAPMTDSESRRAAIRQALEQDQPLAARRAFAQQAITNANPTISTRDALSALFDVEEGRQS